MAFHIYIDGKDQGVEADTLDSALVTAIAMRHDGISSRAGWYFMRMIGEGKTS